MTTSDDQLARWRHALHQIPETAFGEHATSAYIASELASLGFEVATGIGGTGVVGSLTRGDSPRAVGLRADMDALPLQESGTPPYASRHPGVMHACGHDGHMAMVLGAAATLAGDGGFAGTLRVLFQPAEEPGRGAQAMLDADLLARFPLDAVFGLHNLPGIPAGELHVRSGATMAGEDNFRLRIHGRGGHASAPHRVIDPLLIAAEIITALNTIVARSVDPLDHAVVSCTNLSTDGARNAIPSTVEITGDTRSFSAATSRLLEERITQLATGIAAAHGGRCDVRYTREFAPTVNAAGAAQLAAAAARAALGTDRVNADCAPITASEDFGVFATRIPAAFAFLGSGNDWTPLHSHEFDFNDTILTTGVEYYVRLVRDLLPITGQAPTL